LLTLKILAHPYILQTDVHQINYNTNKYKSGVCYADTKEAKHYQLTEWSDDGTLENLIQRRREEERLFSED